MYAKLSAAVIAIAILTASANAQCPVTLQVTGPDSAGTVNATATATGSCGGSLVSIYLDGAGLGSANCNGDYAQQSQCSITSAIETACLTPGPHTITAYGNCKALQGSTCDWLGQGTNSSGVPGYALPSGTIAYNGPDQQGHGTLALTWNSGSPYRAANVYYSVDGGGDTGFYYDPGATSASPEYDLTCAAPGTHTLTEHVYVCSGGPSFTGSASTSATVSGQTTVSGSYDYIQKKLTISYSFPNTDFSGSNGGVFQRSITFDVNGGAPSGAVHDLQQTGSVDVVVDLSCMEGNIHLHANGCNRSEGMYNADQLVPLVSPLKPTLSHTASKNPDGSSHVAVTYTFPAPPGTITVNNLMTGASTPHSGLGASGVLELDFGLSATSQNIQLVATDGACPYATDSFSTDCGCSAAAPATQDGDPIRMWDGDMTYAEHDPLPDAPGSIFSRTYESVRSGAGVFGNGWTSAFDAQVVIASNPPVTSAVVYTESGTSVVFEQITNVWIQTWPTGRGARGSLTGSDAVGYAYREPGSSLVRLYGGSGARRLTGIKDLRTGRQVTISYNTAGVPTAVADSFGAWSCSITTDANQRVTQIGVDGRADLVWNYAYDASGNLTTVTVAGATSAWRTYGYVSVGTQYYLSTVIDALGNTLEQHDYDSVGRAVTSLGPSGDITNVQYNATSPSTTVVTRADGSTTTFEQAFADRDVTTHITGGCGSCGGHDVTAAYDAYGHVWRIQDGRGYVREMLYDQSVYGERNLLSETVALQPSGCYPSSDLSHCALSSAQLAAATLASTNATRTTTYGYADPNWPERPTSIRRPSVVSGGASVTETFTYDATTGTTLTHVVTGSGDLNGTQETHTTTTSLYNGTEAAAFNPGGTFASGWLSLTQPAGLPKSVGGPRTDVSDITQYVYYPNDSTVPAASRARLAAVRNAAGHVTLYADYDVFGHATTITDPNGVVTSLSFDALGRVLSTTLHGVSGCDTAADPLCSTDLTTTNVYANLAGPLASTQSPNGGTTSYAHDSRGRVSSITRGPSLSDSRERIVYTYDAATQKKAGESYQALLNGTWTEKRSEAYAYDPYGRLATVTHPDGHSIAYAYDAADDVQSVRDENHTSPNITYAYDPLKRLQSVTQTAAGMSGGTVVTQYSYDVHDDLASVTDPNGNVTSYSYDDFSRLLQQVSPVTGTTTYAYDLAGDLIASTDANGAATARTYDAIGRLSSAASVRSGSSTETVTLTYDAAARFGTGRLASMSDPSGSTTYAYDRRGLLLNESRTDGGTFTTSYQYDGDGNRSSIVYPSGGAAQYTFDYADRPASMSGGATALLSSASYLPFGPLTSLVYGNSVTKTVLYDTRYRIMENKLAAAGGAIIADYVYAEDAVGNITQIHDAVDPTFNRDFGYDELNRLTTANTGSSLWRTGAYTYDSMGNMLTLDLGGTVEVDPGQVLGCKPCLRARTEAVPSPGSRHEIFSYQGTKPLIDHVTEVGITTPVPLGSDHPVSYDAAGNETHYYADRSYSPRNLTASLVDNSGDSSPAHTIAYAYDGRGVRVRRTESPNPNGPSSRRYFYSPELRLLAVTDDDQQTVWGTHFRLAPNSAATWRYQIGWFGSLPLVQSDANGTLRYTFTDHLGTPLLQTDAAANVIWRAEYEPFGDLYLLRSGTTRADQPLRLPGQELADTWEGHEENYNIFRWYRAGWGRYTQSDPMVRPGAGNPFAYVDDKPLIGRDRLGLFYAFYGPIDTSPDPSRDCEAESGELFVDSHVGCSVLKAVKLGCSCICRPDGMWKPNITAFIDIHVLILNPPLIRPGMATDQKVKTYDDAVAHEEQVHIVPGIEALRQWLSPFEKWGSKGDCQEACSPINKGDWNKIAFNVFKSGYDASRANH